MSALPRRLPKDDLRYAHGLARRAVARAALHLGIDALTSEALDTLSSCLLEYLERLGSAMAHTAEAAGRSSVHCHVLDALAAVELCTPAAAPSMVDSNEGGMMKASWKDLASFCFGSKWHMAETSESAGWNAPYPEEVPHFPRSKSVANPHPFAEPQLHRTDAVEGESSVEVADPVPLTEVPDVVFQDPTSWGNFPTLGEEKLGAKRPLDAPSEDDERPKKRMKVLESRDPTLPTFYPPFPAPHTDDPRVLLTEAAAPLTYASTTHPRVLAAPDAVATRRSVRSALLRDSVVPVGRSEAGATTTVAPSIVPIGRASGSRVSRILEGSMEPPVL